MKFDVQFFAECVLLLDSHKWYIDIRYLAHVLRMTCEEVQEAVDALKKGGQGVRTDGSFKPNPKPYDKKICFSESVDNALNLHEAHYGNASASFVTGSSPSEAVLQEHCTYYRVGNNRERITSLTPSRQREIVKMVVGTHQWLETRYHKLARQRKNIWRGWIDGTDNVKLYDEKHLTYIILYFSDVWNFTLPYKATAEDITSVMRHSAKVEIIELMVCMHILPPESLLKIHQIRRSRRKLSRGSLSPLQLNKRRRIVTPDDNIDGDDDNEDSDDKEEDVQPGHKRC